jgi:hypothetical protein
VDYNKEPNQESKKEENTEYNSSAAAAVVIADSLTGNPETGKPGDGWTAYAKVMEKLTGEKVKPPVQPPVQPKPKPSVQPVDSPVQASVMKSPPGPPNPHKGEAVRLAGTFYAFLGKPAPRDAARKFDALIQDNPDLDALLGFALIPDSRWAEKISGAASPFSYLQSTLEPIREKQELYERKKAEAAARAAKDAPGDDEDFGSAPKDDEDFGLSGLNE